MGNKSSTSGGCLGGAEEPTSTNPSRENTTNTTTSNANTTNVAGGSSKTITTTTTNDDEKKGDYAGGTNTSSSSSSATIAGVDIIKKAFVKIDHFEKIYRIEPKVNGAPNFRQCQGFYIFGGGQPTISAHKQVLQAFQDLGLCKVLWFNMRSEPVIYVNDMSYAPRDPAHPTENIHLPRDITVEEVNKLSDALAEAVRTQSESNNNIFEYHQDTYALLPEDRIDQTKEEPLDINNYNPPVKSLMHVYDESLPSWLLSLSSLSDESKTESNNSFGVKCERLPVNDERAPDAKDVDRLVLLTLKYSDSKTAIVFNCQMGKGRTTEGMIMAALIKKNMNEYYKNLDNTMKNTMDNINKTIFWPTERPIASAEAIKDDEKYKALPQIQEIINNEGDKYYNGNYTIVINLIELLKNKYNLNGDSIKEETDDIIDRCQHLQNLRRCVFSTKLRYEYEMTQGKENSSERASYWKKISLNFLERYYVLICFNAYIHDVISQGGIEKLNNIKYSVWINERKDIQNTLGTYTTGPLSKFNWD